MSQRKHRKATDYLRPNKEIYRENKDLEIEIRIRRLRFYGHMVRMDQGILKKINRNRRSIVLKREILLPQVGIKHGITVICMIEHNCLKNIVFFFKHNEMLQ